MRKILLFAAILAVMACSITPRYQAGQLGLLGVGGSEGRVVSGGFVYLQGTSGANGTNGGWTIQDNACGSTTGTFVTTCSIKVNTTTAGSDMVVGRVMGSGTGHISSAYSCATSNPCLSSSGDLKDTFSLCPGSSCLLTNSALDHDDAAYVADSVGGATVITVTVSSAPSGFDYAEFGEILPPSCGGTPCATVVDNSGNGSTAFSTTSCSPCTGPAFTVTGTDGIIEIIDSDSSINNPSSAYLLDFVGNVFSFDNTTGTGISFATTAAWSLTGVAFKTTTSYSAPVKPFSNLAPGPPADSTTTVGESCTPSCAAFGLPVTTSGTGDLIIVFFQAVPGDTQATILSATDNKAENWTVPSGANTCQQTGGTIDLSCAYIVTASSGVSSFTLTLSTSTTGYFMFYEVATSTGTIALDAQNSSHSSSSSATVTGQTLSLSGGTSGLVDACFAEMGFAGTGTSPVEVLDTLYPLPQGANFFGAFNANDAVGGSMMSLNQRNGTAPIWILSGSATSQESSGICFHN